MSWVWSKYQSKKSDDQPKKWSLGLSGLLPSGEWKMARCRLGSSRRILAFTVFCVLVLLLRSRLTSVVASSGYGMFGSGHSWPSSDPVPPEDFTHKYFALETLFWNSRKSSPPKSQMNTKLYGNIDSRSIPLRQVLIFTTSHARLSKNQIGGFFSKQRFEYTVSFYSDPRPSLVLPGTGRPLFSLIVFDDFMEYLKMEEKSRKVLDDYCTKYSVGILGMTKPGDNKEKETFGYLTTRGRQSMKGYKWNVHSPIWRVAKTDEVYTDSVGDNEWTVFTLNHPTYQPLVLSSVRYKDDAPDDVPKTNSGCVIAYHDIGILDNIEKIVFGNTIDFWLNTIAAMDAVRYLSHGRLQLPLERHVQLDIEQMFVGEKGLKTKPGDADFMVKNQKEVGYHIPGIKYVLGFSGGTFDFGTPEEVRGAKRIVELRDNFLWVNQLFTFPSISKLSTDEIVKEIESNFEFAKKFDLPVLREYILSPKYEGVYPANENLYAAFNKVGINATSSDVYPHLYAEHYKRGFVHRGIRVIPRWTLGVPRTDFNFISELKQVGGKEAMDYTVKKGHFFKKFLFYPVLLLNSKMTNFANDRLGEYSIEHASKLVTTYTNLKFNAPEPSKIVDIYFQQHPEELRTPLWQNPCSEVTHRNMHPDLEQCKKIPDVFILGPSLSGPASLALFMSAHPQLIGSRQNENFFFTNQNYDKGLDWYTSHFPAKKDDKKQMLFEHSSVYFDSLIAPERIAAISPKAKILITTVDPVKRAYAFYLSCKEDDFPIAVESSFYDVITAPDSAPPYMKMFRDLILLPGLYANHLARYIVATHRRQVYVVDGDALVNDPATALSGIQRYLGLDTINFESKLKFNEEIGVYCTEKKCAKPQISTSNPPMDKKSEDLLREFYKGSNEDLKVIMKEDLREPLPVWLEDATSELNDKNANKK